MLSVMNPMGWSLAAEFPKEGIFPLLIFLARSIASLNAIVIFIHCWMLCSSSWVVFKTPYTINVGWVRERRGIIKEECVSQILLTLLGQWWWLTVGWSCSSHSSAEGLSCSEVCIYLLFLSLRKSYTELSVLARLHQVSESYWTGLVSNEADSFVLKKPIREVLTKPICHGQSGLKRTSEPEANQGKTEGIDFREWSPMQITPCLAESPPWVMLHCWAKPGGDLLGLWSSRVALLPAVELCVARRKVTPWSGDQWEGPAAMALLEGVWEPSLVESLELSSAGCTLRTSTSLDVSLKENWERDGVEIIFSKGLLFFLPPPATESILQTTN